MEVTSLRARKQPAQDRSRATVDAILEGAAQVLTRVGYARLTTAAVAERAGVSVGSLYQYFPNKDAVVRALLEQYFERVRAGIERVRLESRGAPLRDRVEGLVRASIAHKLLDPELSMALAEQLPKVDGLSLKLRMTDAVLEGVLGLLEEHADELSGRDPEPLAHLCVGAVDGVLGLALARGTLAEERDTLTEALVTMLFSIL